jgi:mlo protein
MLLGFISFLLSLSQGFIVHICIPETATHSMLPCKKEIRRAPENDAKLCKRKVRLYHIQKLTPIFL